MTDAKKPVKKASPRKGSETFSEEEREAMREYVREKKGAKSGKADGEADVLAKIAEMADADRVIAGRLHALIRATAPDLTAKLWYGMPAYARNGKVVCFFQSAAKFKTRYAMLGFSDEANLDDGAMWPTYFALTELTAAHEAKIGALVRRAVS